MHIRSFPTACSLPIHEVGVEAKPIDLSLEPGIAARHAVRDKKVQCCYRFVDKTAGDEGLIRVCAFYPLKYGYLVEDVYRGASNAEMVPKIVCPDNPKAGNFAHINDVELYWKLLQRGVVSRRGLKEILLQYIHQALVLRPREARVQLVLIKRHQNLDRNKKPYLHYKLHGLE